MPERKDSLATCVIAGTTSSIHSKSREVGIGSSSQLFGDDFKIIFLTSSSDTGRKDEREQATDNNKTFRSLKKLLFGSSKLRGTGSVQ